MNRNQVRTVVAAVAGAVMVLPGVAVAGPGNQAGMDGQGTHQGDVAGPGSPGLRWDQVLPGYRFNDRHEDLVLDSAGHVLVQAIRDSDGRRDLIALNLDDGSVAWTTPHIDASCTVAAAEDGPIFAQLVPRSPTAGAENFNADLVGIDPATGQLIAGMRYTSPETDDEPRLTECNDALRLSDDGHVVVIERGTTLWSFDTAGASITVEWNRSFSGATASQYTNRPAISRDGAAVYFGYPVAFDPFQLVIEKIDLVTGDVLATSGNLGNAFGGIGSPLADDEGGVIVKTRVAGNTGQPTVLTRLQDGGNSLAIDWQLHFDKDQPFTVDDETFDRNVGMTWWLVQSGGNVVAWADGRILAVDRATGQPAWAHNTSSNNNNHDEIIADAAGNVYYSTFGGPWLESLDRDGVNWTIENGNPLVAADLNEARRVGPITPDGTLIVGSTDKNDVIHITAVKGAARERVAGTNRLETAVEVSQSSFFADGSADAVVIAVANNYPDALAGGPLARKVNGPILLTSTDSLPAITRTEIQRLDPDTAHVLGGTAAISQAVEDELRGMGLDIVRYAGSNRFETAGLVADAIGGTSVYVTEGADPNPARGWPDAVAVSGLASLQQRPILLVSTDSLPGATAAALARLGATNITVAGGAVAVSDAVLASLRDYDGDGTDEATAGRVSGPSRYATSAALADRSLSAGATVGNLWFATGTAFPDALTAGPAAALTGGVLLLVDGQNAAGGQAAYDWLAGVDSSRVDNMWLVGGPAAISTEVESKLAQALGLG